jgi:hypothetical protein
MNFLLIMRKNKMGNSEGKKHKDLLPRFCGSIFNYI